MSVKKQIVVALLALAGTWATGAAQARGAVDVQWAVNIAGPIGVTLYSPVLRRPSNAGVLVPVHAVPQPARAYGDRDHDGIPNRYDRVHNPRWDRDSDGVPNRHDHRDGRRDHRQNDRHDDCRDDRQGHRPGR